MKNLKNIILLIGLVEIARADSKEKRISNKWLKVLLLLRILLFLGEINRQISDFESNLIDVVSGVFIGGGIFFAGYCLSKKGLGAGDVKLMAVVGSYLGSDNVLRAAVFSVSYVSGYFLWKLLKEKESEQTQTAFAPFVLAGVITELLMNDGIL